MSKHKSYTPRHAAPKASVLPEGSAKVVKATVLVSGVASVTLTGATVAGGVVASGQPEQGATLLSGDLSQVVDTDAGADRDTTAAAATAASAPSIVTRRTSVSRSTQRPLGTSAKASLLATEAGATAAREQNLDDADPRDVAKALLPQYGFSASEFGCLDKIWSQESGWRIDADNPTSSAYGIPQALTATHSMPAGYMTSAEVQIRWGLDYIKNRYGTPCNAWGFKAGHGWY